MPETHFSALFQAITELLATHSDMFIGIGRNLFRGFAVILVAWFGIKTALSSAEGGSAFRLSELVSLLFTIAFGFTMITYYSNPIPSIGVSFHRLITDQAADLSNGLEVGCVQEIQERLNDLFLDMEQPSPLDVVQVTRYFLAVGPVMLAQ